MFDGLTPTHLLFILVIALVILGPGKLPEAGAALGKAIRGFREVASGRDEERPQPPEATGEPPASA